MFLAFTSSFRSGDLSRQVGAVVSSKEGEIIATGCNDVPKKAVVYIGLTIQTIVEIL